jgi:hypothetical protein
MRNSCCLLLRLALAAGVTDAVALMSARAGNIGGQTNGSTVFALSENYHPESRDDYDQVTSFDITALNSSSIITQAAAKFPGFNFVFAGAPSGPGSHFTPIDPSDFTISVYQPWVVNSPDIKSNGGTTYNRGVKDQDAGGVNILIDYSPKGTDPTIVNFLQAFSVTTPSLLGGKSIVAMDNGGKGGPYYNENNASGTDSNNNRGVPLDATNTEAWMLDDPYVCESGFSGGMGGCPVTTPATDEKIMSFESVFNMFIESDVTYNGKTYEVLWGGFSWGYDYVTQDDFLPEPSTWVMLALGFAGLGALGYHRSRRLAAATATV